MATNDSLEEALRQMAAGAKSVTLYRAEIGDHGAIRLAEALKQNAMLQTLGLPCNSIGTEGARALAEALEQNTTLQTLDLRDNRIRDEDARALAEALQQNTTLQELNLYGNFVSRDMKSHIEVLLKRSKETCIIMQVTTIPMNLDIEGSACDVVVTKMSGEEVFRQPLQPESTLRHVATQVAERCRAPLTDLRWVLPGPRTVGTESLDEQLRELLPGGLG